MATSGTYTYDITWPVLFEQAHMRAGVDLDRLTERDQRFAVNALTAIFSDWANQGPNWWAIDLQTSNLASAQTTFMAPSSTVDLLTVVLRRDSTDYLLSRISQQDYMELPNKSQSGRPTSYWVDKTIPQYTVYLWPLTDVSTDQIRYYRMVQLQDVQGRGTETFNAPYLWTDAITAALALRIGQRRLMEPESGMDVNKLAVLESQYKQSYFNAVKQNSQRTPLKLDIQVSDYYRFG